jgi:type IV pilus assembly protein PilB
MNDFKSIIEKELSEGLNISIINLIDQLIRHAFSINSSDIHIDPLEKSIRVRFRIDGVLEDSYSLPKEIHSEIISRIKVLACLRTDEHYSVV